LRFVHGTANLVKPPKIPVSSTLKWERGGLVEFFLWVVVPIAIVVLFGLVIRWALRWKDPAVSSSEKQAEARLWSKRNLGR